MWLAFSRLTCVNLGKILVAEPPSSKEKLVGMRAINFLMLCVW